MSDTQRSPGSPISTTSNDYMRDGNHEMMGNSSFALSTRNGELSQSTNGQASYTVVEASEEVEKVTKKRKADEGGAYPSKRRKSEEKETLNPNRNTQAKNSTKKELKSGLSERQTMAEEFEEAIKSHPRGKCLSDQVRQKHIKTLLDGKGPSFTELQAVALDTAAKERCKKLPSYFGRDGNLLVPWLYVYGTKISQAREKRKAPEPESEVGDQPSRKGVKHSVKTRQTHSTHLADQAKTEERIIEPRRSRRSSPSPDPISAGSQPSRRNAGGSRVRRGAAVGRNSSPSIPEPQITTSVLSSSSSSAPTSKQTGNIICSRPTCPKRQFDATLLQQTYNLQIEEVQQQLDRDGFWVCPGCEQRSTNERRAQNSGMGFTIQEIQAGLGPTIQEMPRYGEDWLDYKKVRDELNFLSTMTFEYAATAIRKLPDMQVPLLELSFIRDEPSSKDLLVGILRQLLDIHEGVSIRAKIETLRLKPESMVWIQGVLSLLIKQIMFDNGSLFEDASKLKQGLSYIGLPLELIEMIVQDARTRIIRMMKADPTDANEFCVKRKSRLDGFVAQLNEAMFSLVGNDTEINKYHINIAKVASDLSNLLSAHRAECQPIYPKIGDLFDLKYHQLESPELEMVPGQYPRELEGKPVLLTMTPGVKCKVPGGDWAVVSRAHVRLWRPIDATAIAPNPKE